MSTTIQIGDVIEARLNFAGAGATRAFNVQHYICSAINPVGVAPPYVPQPFSDIGDLLALNLYQDYFPAWSVFASDEVDFPSLSVQSVYPLTRSALYSYVSPGPSVGLVNDEALPLQDAPTLVKRTAFGTRWGVGRVFVAGLPEGAQRDGRVLPAAQPALVNFGAVFATPQTIIAGSYSFNFTPILFGPQPIGAPRTTPVVSCSLIDDVIKTQRRRRPGKGI